MKDFLKGLLHIVTLGIVSADANLDETHSVEKLDVSSGIEERWPYGEKDVVHPDGLPYRYYQMKFDDAGRVAVPVEVDFFFIFDEEGTPWLAEFTTQLAFGS